MESLQHFKRPWAHDHEPVKELVNAVKVQIYHLLLVSLFRTPPPPEVSSLTRIIVYQLIKPTVLIGSSGTGKTFTKEVVQAMSTFNKVLFFVP